MPHQLFTNDVSTIKRHINDHQRGKGPMVIARIAGYPGLPQIHDVREELFPVLPPHERLMFRHLRGRPSFPSRPKQLEVQLDPHGRQPWHRVQALYLKDDE